MATGIFPAAEETAPTKKGINIRFTPEERAKLLFVVRLWNAGDAARGVRRSRRWKLSSVVRALVAAQLDALAHQMGGCPEDEQRFILDAVAELERLPKPRHNR